MVYSREGADMDELVKVYGPQAGILIAVVAYLRLQMEGRLNDCKAERDARLADAATALSKAERERDEYKALAFRSVAATERVAQTVAVPQVTP
jgi:hypothetical protein